VLSKRELAFAIPTAFLDSHFLLFFCIHNIDIIAAHRENLNLLSFDARKIDLKVLGLVDIRYCKVHKSIIANCRANIQEWRLDRAPNPVRVGSASVFLGSYIHRNSVTAHVLAEQPQWPPDGLFHEPILRRHEWRDNVDALRNVRHAHVLCLPDEGVQKYSNGQRVRQGVLLLSTLLTRSAHGIPNIPLVKAYRWPRDRLRDFVLDAREINQRTRHLDRAFSSSWSCCVGEMFVIRRVDVDGVHVDQALCWVATETVDIPFHALVEHVVVPGGVTGFTAKYEGDGRVEQLKRLCPLPCLFGIIFFCELGNLPVAPALVTEGPVFYLGVASDGP
jgi:hypothetical protein